MSAAQPAFTVECIKHGQVREEEEQAFFTRIEADTFARQMLNSHYRVWINNMEVTRRDYEHGASA